MISLLAGCIGGSVRDRVESGIEKSLPNLIGPARVYDVNVTGSTLGMIGGKLKDIEIKGEDVRLKNGMQLARLSVSLDSIEFDAGKSQITKCGGANYNALLSEEELGRYLRKAYPDVPKLNVELLNGYVSASASPSLVGLSASIKAEATLDIQDKRKLALKLRKVTVGGIPAPGFARDYMASKINPFFDASQIGYDATISSVTVEPGFVTLAGGLDLMKK